MSAMPHAPKSIGCICDPVVGCGGESRGLLLLRGLVRELIEFN